jgi:ketosteroid isomerase-like protein
MTTLPLLSELDRRWTEAEVRADVPALIAMSTQDFTLVGPVGFVLDRAGWAARYEQGLHTTALRFEPGDTRLYGDTAVTVGRQVQAGTYRGRPVDGEFRVTRIAVRGRDGDAGWRLAGLHFSPIAGRP